MNRYRVLREIASTGLPLKLSEIKRCYIFGSTLYKKNPRDLDLALFVDILHPLYEDDLTIRMTQIQRVEYHLVPLTKWHMKRLRDSSPVKRIFKVELVGVVLFHRWLYYLINWSPAVLRGLNKQIRASRRTREEREKRDGRRPNS